MSLIFSRQCEYAIQGVLYLALKPPGKMTSIPELSKRLDIPYHFLAKILQSLARKGLLTSSKGPTGGFTLGMPAHDITLFHIIEAIDGTDFTRHCVLGFHECSPKTPCAVHNKWSTLRGEVYDMLISKNVGEMAQEMKKLEYYNAN
jgi:Rrf2 family transcriptional regulator, iron-sulfur cluster assembly transcription factor